MAGVVQQLPLVGGARDSVLQGAEGAAKVKGVVPGYQLAAGIRIHGVAAYQVHSGVGVEEPGFVGVQGVLDDE